MNTTTLDRYFDLFDASRTDEQAFTDLVSLFSDKITFVLNGQEQHGIEAWKQFVRMVFTANQDIKHMYAGWVPSAAGDTMETRWAVCGKRADGSVFTQDGMDIARLDADGKIVYLANVPDDTAMFNQYNG